MKRDPNARLEDRLGPNEPPYRSRGEAQVGRLLDRYGIPFVYEQPRAVFDRGRYRIWHPDFTLPTYGDLIVEYAGMPDRPDYLQGIRHKQRAYAQNGIHALIVYPSDIVGPSWSHKLHKRIDSYRREAAALRGETCLHDSHATQPGGDPYRTMYQ